MASIEIPEDAIRDAVSTYIVAALGDNAGKVFREMIKGVLEAKGSFGRTELQNMILKEVEEIAAAVVHEMVEQEREEIEQMVRTKLETDFIPTYVDHSLEEITKKFTRRY